MVVFRKNKKDKDNIHFNELMDKVNNDMESYINLVFKLINNESVSKKIWI